MGKKLLSYSVWCPREAERSSKYTAGVLDNLRLMKRLYPDYTMRVYVGNNVPRPMVEAYELSDGIEVVKIDRDGDRDGLFWRFYPAWDPDVDIFHSRDADSRITPREVSAVRQWEQSGKAVHIMRDNVAHTAMICGGLWGACKGFMPNFKQELEAYVAGMGETAEGVNDPLKRTRFFNSDQNFLNQKVWPVVKNNAMCHDEYHAFSGFEIPFPTRRDGSHFVGE